MTLLPTSEILGIAGAVGYGVTKEGRLFSRRRPGNRHGRDPDLGEWRERKWSTSGKAKYPSIRVDGKNYKAHVVVMALFGPPKTDPTHEIRHMDGDVNNPAISNLEWGTRSQNSYDKRRHGTDNRGTKHPRALFTEDELAVIHEEDAFGVTHREIAKQMGCARETISQILRGDRYGGEAKDRDEGNQEEAA